MVNSRGNYFYEENMGSKTKGINAERDLIHKFWNASWCAVRIAGSGSMKYPSADILASNKLRKLAIECKVCAEESKYFPKEDIKQLKQFAGIFGAEPWVAIKFKGNEWFFISLDDMGEKDKSYVVTAETAKSKGLLFEEIIK